MLKGSLEIICDSSIKLRKNGESKSRSPSLFSNASTIAVSPYQVSQVRRQRVLAQAQLGLQPEIVF